MNVSQKTVKTWLNQLCKMIPGVRCAFVFESIDINDELLPLASWPKDDFNFIHFSHVFALLKNQNGPVIAFGDERSEDFESNKSKDNEKLIIAFPINLSAFQGLILLDLNAKPSQQQVILQLLSWGKEWLSLLLDKASISDAKLDESLQVETKLSTSEEPINTVDLFESLINCRSDYEGYLKLVSEIANYWQLDRVWLGLVSKENIEVSALSNTASFDARSNLVQTIQVTMSELIHLRSEKLLIRNDQTDKLSYQDEPEHCLSTNPNTDYLLVFPMCAGGELIGLVLGEAKQAPCNKAISDINTLLSLVAPLFVLKKQANKSIPKQITGRLKQGFQNLLKGRISRFQFIFGTLFLATLLSGFLQGEHRIASKARLEGQIQRAVVAPFDSYVNKAYMRAGEEVKAGDLIAQLDDQDIDLEKQRLNSQKEELNKQYRKELVGMNHSQIRIIKAQIAQIDAKLTMVEGKKNRTRLVSPLSGMIIEGDLSRSIGAPVKQGQVLFEVAPLDRFRLVLNVDERDIPFLKVGQEGYLVLKAYPNKEIFFRLEKVATVYQQDQGKITYRTEASFNSPELALRPGMEGLAKVSVGKESYIWLVFHQTFNWLRFQLWSWMP